MAVFTPGSKGSIGYVGREAEVGLPPGQHVTGDFPVLSAGPTPQIDLGRWELGITTETGARRRWNWAQLLALPTETITADIHCVTTWSKLGTNWRGVSLDILLEDVSTTARYALVQSFGGYSTNLPLAALTEGQAWIAYEYDDEPLTPQHGGPARLLVPHLYFWKSAKWIREIQLLLDDEPGFWESVGYHNDGDPRREQRHWDN